MPRRPARVRATRKAEDWPPRARRRRPGRRSGRRSRIRRSQARHRWRGWEVGGPRVALYSRRTRGAAVRFITPRTGSTVTGSTVHVRVRVTGFTLDARDVGKPARQGFGHLHFSLDGGRYDTPRYSGANGALAARIGAQGKYSPSV